METPGIIWSILESPLEILVHQGCVYLPLLFDPAVEQECHTLISEGAVPSYPPAAGTEVPPPVLALGGSLFVQAVRAAALVEHFEMLFPKEHLSRRRLLRERYSLNADLFGVALDPELFNILFHILPHFLRRDGLPRRRPLQEGEILDLIRERLPVPYHFIREARRFLDIKPVKTALNRLDVAPEEPPPEGLILAPALRAWWEEALAARLLNAERRRLQKELADREQWTAAQEDRLAVLLYVAAKGTLELDGFGFTRLRESRGYR